ncbi:beta-lactamase family protein, partial [Bacillus cereus]|nr:beta-lactamase family protein [Bacillus cereus]
HLNKGNFGNQVLICVELLHQIYTPHISIQDQPVLLLPELLLDSYGHGWFISSYCGNKVINHGGNIDGFSSLVSCIPTENIGLVILTNAGGTLLPTYLANQIYDELLELESIDWHKRAEE